MTVQSIQCVWIGLTTGRSPGARQAIEPLHSVSRRTCMLPGIALRDLAKRRPKALRPQEADGLRQLSPTVPTMRIALIGQAAFGKAVLEAIADAGKDEIAGVFPPPDREGRPIDPLKDAALARGVAVFQPGRYRSPEAVEQFRSLAPDLCVMAYVTDIVPDEMIEAPRHGTIQYHPSLLPRHRGPSSINWSIVFGETTTGLTIFWPDHSLDTGPILLQKEVPVGPDDTVGSLYFNHLFPLGVEAMLEAIEMVREGRAPRITQDESQATYESWCSSEDAAIEWSKPVHEVYNLIRGCNPQPGAHTTHGDDRLRVFDSEKRLADPGVPPGTVVSVSEDGFEVAAGGGSIFVRRAQPAGSRKMQAGEYAASTGLREGRVLGG